MIRVRFPKETIDLDRIYSVSLLTPDSTSGIEEPLVSIATFSGPLVEFSMRDVIKFGKWWEKNKMQIFAEMGKQCTEAENENPERRRK